MKRALLVALVVSSIAHADAQRAMPADAALVASVRPIAVLGAVQRIGSGWETMVRRSLPLPSAVNPFDPALLTTFGIDPAARSWAAVRASRSGVQLRLALALTNARFAEPLLQSVARLASVELVRGPKSSWTGHGPHGQPIVARVDADTLVVDVLFPTSAKVPSVAELAQLAPIKPARPWAPTHGAGHRDGAEDALALWADLPAVVEMSLAQQEARLPALLQNAEATQRAQLLKVARDELATCRAAAHTLGGTFDDAVIAVSLSGVDALKLDVSMGGRRQALDALRVPAPTKASRALAEIASDADLRLLVTDPSVLRSIATIEHTIAVPVECPGPAMTAISLRSWPSIRRGPMMKQWLRVLAGLRGLVALVPSVEGSRAAIASSQLSVVAELDANVRGDLDPLVAEHFTPSNPLRVGGRQLTTFAPSAFDDGEVLAIDPIATPAGSVVALGTRESLRALLERLSVGANGSALGSVATSPRGWQRLARELASQREDVAPLVDGIDHVDAAITLAPEVLAIDATVSLHPRER